MFGHRVNVARYEVLSCGQVHLSPGVEVPHLDLLQNLLVRQPLAAVGLCPDEESHLFDHPSITPTRAAS